MRFPAAVMKGRKNTWIRDVCLIVKMTQEYTGIEKTNLVLGSNMLVDWCAFVFSTCEQLFEEIELLKFVNALPASSLSKRPSESPWDDCRL